MIALAPCPPGSPARDLHRISHSPKAIVLGEKLARCNSCCHLLLLLIHTVPTKVSSLPLNPLTCASKPASTAMSRHLLVAAVLVGATITALYSATTVAADTPGSCPYPCLPPPIAGGVVNSYPPPPPAGSSSSSGGGAGGGGLFGGSYPPPPPGEFQLTPPGVMPGAFAPPVGGGFPYGPAPPPPNPILPWFPWYYQHNNPITGSTTSAAVADLASASMVTVVLLALFLVALLRVS